MKLRIFILLVVTLILNVPFVNAQDFPDKYLKYGKVYISTLNNSAFPSDDRKEGMTKEGKTYTYEENYSDNSVIVFIPNNYNNYEGVDIVFFFYGWLNSNYYSASTTDLIKQFIDSKKRAVLVFPAMAKFAPDSFDGNFKNKDVFKNYVWELIDSLNRNSLINSHSLNNIILCGHSGGYRPIVSILKTGGMENNIKEIFLLDALYGEVDIIFKWIRDYNGKIVSVATQRSSPLKNNISLMKKLNSAGLEYISSIEENYIFSDQEIKTNIFLETNVDHGAVLEKNLNRYLKMSSLKDFNY